MGGKKFRSDEEVQQAVHEWISNLLNRLLHEFLGLTPAMNLTIIFCKVNIVFAV
jgi:hypothetical protein